MSDKELIKQEIERLKHTSNAYDRSRFMLLLEIEEFINSIPEEPNEDLEEAAKQHSKRTFNGILIEDNIDAFKAGAEWQKQKDLEDSLKSDMTMPNKFYEKGRFDMREEMMKDAVEGTVKYEIGSAEIPQCDKRYQVLSNPAPIANAKLGDKVKIIIVKED